MKPIQLVVFGLTFAVVPAVSAQERRAREATAPAENAAPAGPRVAKRPDKPAYETKVEPLATKVDLAAARALFKSADADANGTLDAKEAAAAGLGPRDGTAGDTNGDKLLSGDEFLVSYSGMLTRLGRPVTADLTAEAARVAAAAKTQPATQTPAATPPAAQPAPATQPTPVPRTAQPAKPASATPESVDVAKSEIERKIEEALRTAAPAAGEDTKGKARERRAEVPVDPALAAKETLNRRLRNAEVSPEQAAEERAKLTQRIDNAAQAAQQRAAGPSGAPQVPSTPPPGGVEAAAKNAEVALEQRLANTGADAKVAEAAREKLDQRVQNAQNAAAGQTAPPTAPTPAGNAESDGAAKAARAESERKALEQRLSQTGASAEASDEARKKLEKRIANSNGVVEGGAVDPNAAPKPTQPDAKTGSETPATGASKPTEAERAQAMRDALEKRIKETGADEKSAQEARDKLERRIKNAEAAPATGTDAGAETKPAEAKPAETKPAETKPAVSGDAQADSKPGKRAGAKKTRDG